MAKGFEQFTEDLLVALVDASGKNENGAINALEVAKAAKLEFRPGWVVEAVSLMEERDWVRMSTHVATGRDATAAVTAIRPSGTDKVVEIGENRLIGRRGMRGEMSVTNHFVTFRYNDPDRERAIEAISKTIEVVSENKAYATADPINRNERLGELEAGSQLIQASRAPLESIKSVLLSALEHLAKKFDKQPIGTAASEAFAAVTALLLSMQTESERKK
jgi:hypothetical protein